MGTDMDTAWLVLGGIHLLNGTAPLGGDDAIGIVAIPRVESNVPSNTIVIDWASHGQVEVVALSVSGAKRGQARLQSVDLFTDMQPGDALSALLRQVGGDRGAYVPLFYVSGDERDDGLALHVYSQTRFLVEDACFIRITPEPLVVASIEDLSWLPTAVGLHAQHALFLNNHQCYYRRLFPGRELEYKYALASDADIWGLTAEIYRALRAGELPDFIMEYRDEFQAWDYLNHLFEVQSPPEEQGYVSFIPTTDGMYTIKRKWYAEDSFDRGEMHYRGVAVDDGGMSEYLSRTMGLSARSLPPFRRVRYDVNFESVRTGHIYGVFFDHSSLLCAPQHILRQCELEYIRSRTVVPVSEADVKAELEHVAEWLEGFLRQRGQNAERGTYSKLSFLRDVVSANPELEVAGRS